MNDNNRKVFGSIIGIVIFIFCLFSVTYAFYKWKSNNTNVDIGVHAGGLKFVYSNNNILSSTTLSPVMDYTDDSYYTNNNGSLLYVDYKVTNTKDTSYKMITKLNITTISDALKNSTFKWVLLTKDEVSSSYKEVTKGDFSNLEIGENTLNSGIYFEPDDQEKDYRFVIYIDGNQDNSSTMMNSNIVSNLVLCDEEMELFNITLNNQGADDNQGGTNTIYEKYGVGVYLDSDASSKKMTATTNGIVVPRKTGYVFDGYYTLTNGMGDKLISSNGYITSSFTKNYFTSSVSLYANWILSKHNVTYNYSENGGTSATKTSEVVTSNSDIDLTPTAYKSGYEFVGWNTDKDAHTKLSSLKMQEEDVVLYAIFKKSGTVTFDPNGNTNFKYNNVTYTSASTINLCDIYNKATTCTKTITMPTITAPSNTPTLLGWSSGATNYNVTYNSGQGNVTLTSGTTWYAQTTKESVTLIANFDGNGATLSSTSAKTCTLPTTHNGVAQASNCTVDAPTITRSGYNIIGYNTDKNATSSSSTYNSSTGRITLSKVGTTTLFTYYAITSKTSTATFYYYSSGVKSSTSSCTIYNTTTSNCNITIPSGITSSKGQYGNAYVGLAATTGTTSLVSNVTSANLTYYAVYRSNVTIYRPTSTTAVSSLSVYRNSYFTSTSYMNTVLSSTQTGTSSMSSVSGLYGTLSGFASSANSTTVSYSSISALAQSTVTVAYAISSQSKTITFYYYGTTTSGGSWWGGGTTSSGVKNTTTSATTNYYCKSQTTIGTSGGTVSVPSEVTSSTGQYSNSYVGVASSTGTMTTVSNVTSENSTYYAVYRSNVTIYRPTSTTAASGITAYRNSYFTSTSAMSTVLSTSTTGTSNMTSVSGVYGTLKGFASSVNSTTISYSSISALATSTVTMAYAISSQSSTVTFYYYGTTSSGSWWGGSTTGVKTTTASADTNYYCKTTSTSGTSGGSSVSVPSEVTSSTGQYGNAYVGVASSTGTATTVSSVTGANSKYYAIYRSNVAIYRPTSASTVGSVTAYRNSYFTSTSAMSTVLSSSTTGTSNMTSVSGIYGTLKGFASSVNSTTVSYSSISALATATVTSVYAITTMNATITFHYYNKGVATTTASANATYYCKTTSTIATSGSSTVDVPSAVTSSKGQYSNSYVGVASSTGTMSTVSNVTSSSLNYYAVYRKNVKVDYPSSSTTLGSLTAYRNSYFTSTSAMTTVISSSTTGTSNMTSISGLYGTLKGFATYGGNEIVTSNIAGMATLTFENFQAVTEQSTTLTFYYYGTSSSGSWWGSSTSGVKTTTSTVTITYYEGQNSGYFSSPNGKLESSTSTASIPSTVTSSKGPNSASYSGVSTSPSSTTTTTTITGAYTKYYAVYSTNVTATFTKDSNVSSIGSTSSSCAVKSTTNGSTYSTSSCSITLPSITPASGYSTLGWYNSSGTLVGKPSSQITISASATYTAKVQKDSSTTPSKPTTSTLALGDYVSMTPTKSSYTTDKTKTGYTSTQTINPQELNLWRVISKNSDGTYGIISEYVSSTLVYFVGKTGYKNYIGYLNVLASQYVNSTYTSGSRSYGYNSDNYQTEYITSDAKFVNPAPWTCSTGRSCNPVESQGGGDNWYTGTDPPKDYQLIRNVLGTSKATTKNGTEVNWWLASRYYTYNSATDYRWSVYFMMSDGEVYRPYLYAYNTNEFVDYSKSAAIRPILTLKSGLKYSGSGTKSSPYVPSR